MKRWRLIMLVVALAAIGFLVYGSTKLLVTPSIRASYRTSSEGGYEDIHLVGRKLSAIYLPTTFRPDPRPLVQAPEYDKADLKHASARLTWGEAHQFVELVRSSGFLELKDEYGDRRPRSYGHKISVTSGGKSRTVVYLEGEFSRPPMPKAFATMREWLTKTCARKWADYLR